MKADNIVSIADARRALRMRRLVGAPFAKQFLLEQDHIFKSCTKALIERVDKARSMCNEKVDVAYHFKKYAFDLLSLGYPESD